jgi:hypothetical protein
MNIATFWLVNVTDILIKNMCFLNNQLKMSYISAEKWENTWILVKKTVHLILSETFFFSCYYEPNSKFRLIIPFQLKFST